MTSWLVDWMNGLLDEWMIGLLFFYFEVKVEVKVEDCDKTFGGM